MTHRPIWKIAEDIEADWKNVSYTARPYLDAMFSLTSADNKFGCDSAKNIVLYFLSNASSYRGEKARQYKAELKAIFGLK